MGSDREVRHTRGIFFLCDHYMYNFKVNIGFTKETISKLPIISFFLSFFLNIKETVL